MMIEEEETAATSSHGVPSSRPRFCRSLDVLFAITHRAWIINALKRRKERSLRLKMGKTTAQSLHRRSRPKKQGEKNSYLNLNPNF